MQRSIGILLLSLAACSGGSGVFSTVDGSESTKSLSQTEQAQLCNDAFEYAKGQLDAHDRAVVSCGLEPTNDTPEDCPSNFDACVAQKTAALESGPAAAPDCTAFAADLAQCNTTVSEYTKCFAQHIGAVQNLASRLPICSQGATQSAVNDSFSHLSSDCVLLLVTCPRSFVPLND